MTQTAAAMLIALGAGWYSPAPCVVGRSEIAGGLSFPAFSARVSDRIATQFGPAITIEADWYAQTREATAAMPSKTGNAVMPTPAGGETPAPIPAIPLPPSALLLLSAVAGLALLRRLA